MIGALRGSVGIVAVAATLAVSSARAQQPLARDSLLDRLIGTWVLRGPMAGKTVTHDVSVRWVLGNEYVEVREVSRERTKDGPEYEAIVYIGRDAKTREYAALWMDNTAYGAFAPAGTGHGVAAGDSIAFVFVESATSRFHNTFAYHRGGDTWEWHLDNDDARGRRMFARVTLTRK